MPAPPITVTLSKFEQLEILRAEIEAREEELHNLDRQIRELLFELERQKFLKLLHPLFQRMQPPQDLANLGQLNTTREQLTDALQTMRDTMTALETETAGQAAPASRLRSNAPPAAPGIGRKKFDSFDDFKAAKGH
ncbi:MAG TPA: hypothetical protein VGP72_05755 [Planctomycetota bacterium]|jgi:hypothetical protein